MDGILKKMDNFARKDFGSSQIVKNMKTAQRHGQNKVSPPYETLPQGWKKTIQGYRSVLHLRLSRAERMKWMRTASHQHFRVFSCGWYVEAHGHFCERENLDEAVYIYCTAGQGFFRSGGQEWTISPGQLLYCAPLIHHCYGAASHQPWTIFWMHVSGPEACSERARLGLTPQNPVKHVGIRPRAIAAFQSLFHFLRPPFTEARMATIIHSARLALACLALESGEEVASEAIAAGLQSVIHYMEQHVSERGNLPKWLKLFGGSRSHFQRQFKRSIGFAPNDYFMRLKIRLACSLLLTSNLRISEIAERVGMSDAYYFSRLFRRVTGSSPRSYLNRVDPLQK